MSMVKALQAIALVTIAGAWMQHTATQEVVARATLFSNAAAVVFDEL